MSYRKNQKGGAVRMPARYFDNKNLFSGPNCQSCTPQQTGGGCGCMRKFWTDQSKQEGGSVRMPARYFNDTNLFQGPNCNCEKQGISHLYQPCECARKNQKGGNATGAPFHAWTQGAPLNFHKPFQAGEGPVFDPLTPDPNW